jgi:hypothetical protein
MRADPEEFRAAARRLRAEQQHMNVDVGRLRSAQVFFQQWKTPAAREFSSGYYQATFQTLNMPIRDFNALAGALERAAAELEAKIAQAARIERNVHSWFASQPDPEDGSPPIWEQQWWRYRPGRLPASKDSEWFTVQRYLRNRGVWV